jgi:hypothetical protein
LLDTAALSLISPDTPTMVAPASATSNRCLTTSSCSRESLTYSSSAALFSKSFTKNSKKSVKEGHSS